MAGTKTSGRTGYGIDVKIGRFKNLAWDFILEECKNKDKLREYIRLFGNRLIPQSIEGTAEGGAIKIVIDSALADKYGITPSTKRDSE